MWKQGLSDFFKNLNQQAEVKKKNTTAVRLRIEEIVQTIILPTLQELSSEFKRYGRDVEFSSETDRAVIRISYHNEIEMTYGLKVWLAGEDTIWISSLKDARNSRVYKASVGDNIKDFVINACLSEYYDTMLNKQEKKA